jgi:DNA-binding PucR family transcriptional regulator
VHPNTLRYRLGRYRELTGADLSVTEEMIGAWWALHRDPLARSDAADPGAR